MHESLERDDLINGLRLVAAKLHARRQTAGIRIVGGAALALRYFDRRTTFDIDADLCPEQPVLDAALEVARDRGWPPDWLNSHAAKFIPSYGRSPEWELLYSDASVTIEVASPQALLAMKLNASRPGRDTQDIALLLSICGIANLEAAEDFVAGFSPGDGLSDRALRLLHPIFQQGLPAAPSPPPPPFI